MVSYLDGREIYSVRHKGGSVAGHSETIELHVTGGVIEFTDKSDVDYINEKIAEAIRAKLSIDEFSYLRWSMIEDGIM